MSLYNNLNDDTEAHVLLKKIETMFEEKSPLNRTSVFRKIVRLRYQDASSMDEHVNAFQGLIIQMVSLEIPLANEVLALLLLGSLLDSWETLVVTLSNSTPQGKHLTLDKLKSSLLNEEARRKDKESNSDHMALITKSDTSRGRGMQRALQNRDKSRSRSKSKRRHVFLLWVLRNEDESG